MQTKLTKKKFSAQVLWFIPIIPALGSLKQEDRYEPQHLG
jgi:hypothetical protein